MTTEDSDFFLLSYKFISKYTLPIQYHIDIKNILRLFNRGPNTKST